MRFAVLCLLATLAAASPVVCYGHTLTVDCSGGAGYSTIHEAVAAASSGDTIAIAACVYEEQVVIPDIALTLVGTGAGITEVTWSGSGAAVESGESPLVLRRLTIHHTPGSGLAIAWDEGLLTLEDCHVTGSVRGGDNYGHVSIRRSEVDWLMVFGGFRASTVEQSRIGYAAFMAPWPTCHSLTSSGTTYGRLLPCLTQCFRDTIGYVELCGAVDSAQDLHAEECAIDTCIAGMSPVVEFTGCRLGKVMYETGAFFGALLMRGCLVTGDVTAADALVGLRTGVLPTASGREWGYCIEHNTILGAFTFDSAPPHGWSLDCLIRSNVVGGLSAVSFPYAFTVSHNDFVGGLELVAPAGDVFENISEDPEFCGAASGDYTVHEGSPCDGAAHDGLVIGAFGVGCSVPVEPTSWGAIKTRFR